MANHISVDTVKFDPDSISEETHAFNQKLMNLMSQGPKWYEVGAAKYRQMRARGETPLPAAVHLSSAESYSIPSRDQGRSIPCRILKPQDASTSIKGIFMHIHGGGWVLQDETSQDTFLQTIADDTGLMAISIGYRLAPEDPYPAGPNDCFDAAEWLIVNSAKAFHVPLLFIGGDSAGGHLSMLVILHLLQHSNSTFSNFAFKGALLHYGCFDLSLTPSVYTFQKPQVLILDRALIERYLEAFIPGMSLSQTRDPKVSPMYFDFQKLRGRLPPALFTCGTEDPLLDDTVLMSAKYMAAGAETVVKILPGAPHAYILFAKDIKGSLSEIGLEETAKFVNSKID